MTQRGLQTTRGRRAPALPGGHRDAHPGDGVNAYPLDFCGPELTCDWCGELADGCACGGNTAAQRRTLLSAAVFWQRPPRPGRIADRMSPALKHFAFVHVRADLKADGEAGVCPAMCCPLREGAA